MIQRIEELSMNAIPSLSTTFHKGWIIRRSENLSKRANSVYPLYDTADHMDSSIEACQAYYQAYGQQTIFKITELPSALALDKKLIKKNYQQVATTNILTLSLDTISPRKTLRSLGADYSLKIYDHFDKDWFDAYIRLNTIDPNKKEIFRKMLHTSPCHIMAIALYHKDDIIGIGYGAGEDGYVGIYGIAISEEYRQNGYGILLMDSLHKSAYDTGHHTAYLMVVDENSIAKNLYAKLGYSHLYKYWYRIEPQSI